MPAIADQVTSLENDHAVALAQIAALTTANGQLTDTLNSLTTDHAAALAKVADLTAHNTNIMSMVESVAESALAMMKAAAPLALAEKTVTDITSKIETAVGLVAAAPVAVAVAVAVVAEPVGTLTSDSGDEQPARTVGKAPALAAPYGRAAIEQEIVDGVKTVVADVENIPAAVDRLLHHSSAPPVTKISAPVDMTMIVEHDDHGLPMFLRRGTVFDDLARARLAT